MENLPEDECKILRDLVTQSIQAERAVEPDAAGAIERAFRWAYEKLQPETSARQYAALLQFHDEDAAQALGDAIDQANALGFLMKLWLAAVGALPPSHASVGALQQALKPFNAMTGGVGLMQASVSPGAALDFELLARLYSAGRAIGRVRSRNGVAPVDGTGFLVGRDLLLTSAHVVFHLTDGQSPLAQLPGSGNGLFVEFLNGRGGGARKVLVAEQWLTAGSAPNGKPPQLAASGPHAGQLLDFALIRLAEPLGDEFSLLDIDKPPPVKSSDPLVIIGFPGGTQCKWDKKAVLKLDTLASRVEHNANTDQGMSGSPCLDFQGRVVALHEGCVTDATNNAAYNRAVYMLPIRKAIAGINWNQSIEPLWQIDDVQARREWLEAGQRFCPPPAGGGSWRTTVGAFDPVAGSDMTQLDAHHPVFGRREFQDWVTQARREQTPRRLALISGGIGTGKSFSATLLRFLLRGTDEPVAIVPPELARDSNPASALSCAFAALPGTDNVAVTEPRAPRTRLAAVALDQLPDELARLHRALGQRRRLWLVLDFGRDGDDEDDDPELPADVCQMWRNALPTLVAQDWLRVVMIGLSDLHEEEFRSLIANDEQVYSEKPALSDLQLNDFRRYLGHVRVASGSGLSEDALKPLVDGAWKQIKKHDSDEGRLPEAVRHALRLREALYTHGGVR